ncbi:hypothetical protein LJB42_002140 [Komagataella kurtzmanii]|nr:hypothetical protein LJB42_002140 [Komagataella kurtzmanii]
MVDIRDFFGNAKQSTATQSKLKRKVSDAEKIVSKKPKTPTEDENVRSKANQSPFFSSNGDSQAANNKGDAIILDSDDDDLYISILDEDSPEKLKSPISQRKRKNSPTEESPKKPKSPVKKKASSTPKSKPVVKVESMDSPKPEPKIKNADAQGVEAPKLAEKSTNQFNGLSAEAILETIPDAELPEEQDTAKLSLRDFKKKQTELPQSSTPLEDLPQGRPNCLIGLTMVFTGVMPTIDRTQAEELAKRYGAKVTKSVSKKTSVVVLGSEAGPSKVKKIKDFKIKAIDEDGFITLIKSMPADGGSGEAAAKALEKKKQEEELSIKQAEKEEAESQKNPSAQEATNSALWTVKYAPANLNQVCGNKTNIKKLTNWLSNWFENKRSGFKHPGPDGTGVFRACLISGPPGIGKTTAAHLVAKSLGFDIIEKNASDVRSKSLLMSDVKTVLDNTSLVGFFHSQDNAESNQRKFCLIMDEVDGMSSGDHGGVGALAQFCRITSTPIILICNDKSLPKMRPFDRVTLDLPFRRPSASELKSRIMTIAHREKLQLDPNVIDQLVEATKNDIRQIINLLSTVSKTQKIIGFENAAEIKQAWKKEVALKPFDITSRILSGGIYAPSSKFSLNDKLGLFFDDIDFSPLMVHENYRSTVPTKLANVSPNEENLKHLELLSQAADSISEADLVNNCIRGGEQQWSLLPFFGLLSTVRASSFVAGSLRGRINFTSYLGQNSKKLKYDRLLQELQYHSSTKTLTNNIEFRLSYMSPLITKLSHPLLEKGTEGIDDVMSTLDAYCLTKEDWDTIMDFGIGSYSMGLELKKIPPSVKTAFTRKYNSYSHPTVIYATGNSVSSTRVKVTPDLEDVVQDDMDDVEDDTPTDEGKSDIKNDKLIKEVKPKKKKATSKAKSTASKRKKN